jgi:superfamily II DNA or RNA helicase
MSGFGTLAQRCSRAFTHRVIERGVTYFRTRPIDLEDVEGDPKAVSATVWSSETRSYHVSLAWNQSLHAIVARCDCAAALRSKLCKHVYAVLLCIDERGALEDRFPTYDPVPIVAGLAASGRRGTIDGDDDGEPRWIERRVIDDDEVWLDEVSADDDFDPDDDGGDDPRYRSAPWRSAPRWLYVIEAFGSDHRHDGVVATRSRGGRAVLEYHADVERGTLTITFLRRNILGNGQLGTAHATELRATDLATRRKGMLDDDDVAILTAVLGCRQLTSHYHGPPDYETYGPGIRGFVLRPSLASEILPRLCATGRFGLTAVDKEHASGKRRVRLLPLRWDGRAYRLVLAIEPGPSGDIRLAARLRADDAGAENASEPANAATVLPGGIVLFDDRLALVSGPQARDAYRWVGEMAQGAVEVPHSELHDLMIALAGSPGTPELEIHPDLGWTLERTAPEPMLSVYEPPRRRKRAGPQGEALVTAALYFVYQGECVPHGSSCSGVYRGPEQRLVTRDIASEQELVSALVAHGFARAAKPHRKRPRSEGEVVFEIRAGDFPRTARRMLEDGWHIQARGSKLRGTVKPWLRVRSQVDWFELRFGAAIDDANLELPELLAAIKRRDGFVKLSDGSLALLPEEWLERFAALAEIGSATVDGSADALHLCVGRSAGVLLDVMLAAQADVDVDAGFERFRRELQSFERVVPLPAPPGFGGTLRAYQEVGLGWLKTLERFGFGGCLADDMGLGKTVQVLALLASSLRTPGGQAPREQVGRGPSLVVAPKSLVFNWLDEAKRFTPGLRTATYLGNDRRESACFDEVDLVVTTYGTLRRDIDELASRRFHYVVLDEASVIKNADSQSAKACRLLSANHRLALTGTPIENRFEDLVSILDFLNPGMLRGVKALEGLVEPSREPRDFAALARVLKPFLLRRTKEQVLSELPDKTEQVLRCELGRRERALYDQLRDHYRALIEEAIRTKGLARSKIHVLEALLRLRQAACHPGLLDESRKGESSAKLDTLMESLVEVVAAGHKALVFSQFTSFLAIARDRLDRAGISYSYLDGSTRKRKEAVERFQHDPSCRAFLISLKAGGHGLNLTAAEYVFLLDPWWNPAVEAQAIDRAHRIGQERPVFAYRMIAEATVEERVLELGESKRALAEAIFQNDGSLIGSLTVEDLEVLLG